MTLPFFQIGCNVGYYGENCSAPCPSNCQESRCDASTGHCQSFKPGCQGQFCDQGMCKCFFVMLIDVHE